MRRGVSVWLFLFRMSKKTSVHVCVCRICITLVRNCNAVSLVLVLAEHKCPVGIGLHESDVIIKQHNCARAPPTRRLCWWAADGSISPTVNQKPGVWLNHLVQIRERRKCSSSFHQGHVFHALTQTLVYFQHPIDFATHRLLSIRPTCFWFEDTKLIMN